jgi:hypothetical protein
VGLAAPEVLGGSIALEVRSAVADAAVTMCRIARCDPREDAGSANGDARYRRDRRREECRDTQIVDDDVGATQVVRPQFELACVLGVIVDVDHSLPHRPKGLVKRTRHEKPRLVA